MLKQLGKELEEYQSQKGQGVEKLGREGPWAQALGWAQAAREPQPPACINPLHRQSHNLSADNKCIKKHFLCKWECIQSNVNDAPQTHQELQHYALQKKTQAGTFITPEINSTLHWSLSQHMEPMPGFLKLCFCSLGPWRYSNTRQSDVQNDEVMAFQCPRHLKTLTWPSQPCRCPQTCYKLSIPKCSNNSFSIVAISLQIRFWMGIVGKMPIEKKSGGEKDIYKGYNHLISFIFVQTNSWIQRGMWP